MAKISRSNIKSRIKIRAKSEGFSSVHLTVPSIDVLARKNLREYLDRGFHGQMSWLERRFDWRSNSKALWPEARSIIVLGDSYTPKIDVMDGLAERGRGNLSVYAHGRDYHDVIKKKLKKFGSWLVNETGAQIKVFVDTAPVMEKPLAQKAGLGWQGKHTNLVSRKLGNWFFIGVIFTSLEIDSDEPEIDHCGACSKCLDICPTSAFVEPYKLDARKCISYLTIEHKGPVEIELRPKIGNRIYGCDDCLAVCPWNKFAVEGAELKYFSKQHLNLLPLEELVLLTDKSFRENYSGSPIKRIGRDRFVRNVIYAIGNSGQKKFIDKLRLLINDSDYAIREGVTWALSKLGA